MSKNDPRAERGKAVGVVHTSGAWVRLSDPEMKPRIDALKKKIKEDPQFGRDLMVKAGILTKGGNLSKKFGGR